MTTAGSPRKYSRGTLVAISILFGLAILGIITTAVLITLALTGLIG
jgi:hypothetical protein